VTSSLLAVVGGVALLSTTFLGAQAPPSSDLIRDVAAGGGILVVKADGSVVTWCAASTIFAGGDNYFCRRRVSKGVSPTTWRHSVVVVGRSVAGEEVSAGAPASA